MKRKRTDFSNEDQRSSSSELSTTDYDFYCVFGKFFLYRIRLNLVNMAQSQRQKIYSTTNGEENCHILDYQQVSSSDHFIVML